MTNQPKKIYQYDLNGEFVRQFDSLREAAFFNKGTKQNIKCVCDGKHIHCYKFYFTYEYRLKLDKNSIPYFRKNANRIICKFDLNGKYIEYYLSIKQAALKNNVRSSGISHALRNTNKHTCGGFIWIRNLYRDLSEDELQDYFVALTKVYQYDLNGNFINEFDSVADASDKLKIGKTGIWSVLNNYQNIKRYKNFIFSYELKHKVEPYVKAESSLSKIVYKYDLEGNFLKEYKSANDASKKLKINCASICACCLKRPKYYSANGFIWRYQSDVKSKRKLPKKDIEIPTNELKVYQYDLKGNYLAEYKSISIAARKNNIKINALNMCINGTSKTSGGFIWKLKKLKKIKIPTNKCLKPILQYTLDGKLIKEWNSINEAIRHYNNTGIGCCVKGRNKTSGGFIWKYKN
jgi:hypothetical protein